MAKISKYFSEGEFQRCNPPCSIEEMDEGFLSLLDKVRERAGIPLLLTCAYRTKASDMSKGRSGNSAHTRGKAVDIVANQSSTRHKIIAAAMKEGVNRIGLGKNFVHLDCDTSLPQNVFWHYY